MISLLLVFQLSNWILSFRLNRLEENAFLYLYHSILKNVYF